MDPKQEVFNKVKKVMQKYEKYFTANINESDNYGLVSLKSIEIAGRKRDSIAFASLIIQKNYVAFYYMPIYAEPLLVKEFIQPELLNLLKGKSCFHLTKVNRVLLKQIDQLLQRGRDYYEDQDWV